MKKQRNIVYLSHGGGPMPLLGDPNHREMIETLKAIARDIRTPSAILVISAHWESDQPTVTSGAMPELIYDYYGFPEEAYSIQYPCAGEPKLARDVVEVMTQGGINATYDASRGFDHGLFVPLKLMYPESDIPCVQLSLANTLDPQLHLEIGKALQHLDWDNLLIVGSGFSFHNMRAFFADDWSEANANNLQFDAWLKETMSDRALAETTREQRLVNWDLAPAARFCHPREEHLLPLHVCYGAAGHASDKVYQAEILKKQSSMFLWTSS